MFVLVIHLVITFCTVFVNIAVQYFLFFIDYFNYKKKPYIFPIVATVHNLLGTLMFPEVFIIQQTDPIHVEFQEWE